ncbi:putative signal transduction histidine kinase [Variovorax paradoxus B4]|uniref:Putative signal transduction histidine kinase n=1 Tax=Variovorax paradoxus B4 TaxID=1246301 RepID=T1X4T6_VARPD|nr:sensor histidine kinase [Variovorax paradoxus]AGU47588.1 putative signal transduction histidine kinase [Variovorax paradoxus B4]
MSLGSARRLHARLLEHFSRYRFASFWANVVLVVSIALLVVMAAFFSASDAGQETAALHLTHADWQVEDAPGFRAMPLAVDGEALPPAWQPVELPLALPIALLRQADGSTSTGETRITWLRLSTHGLPATPAPLALYGARIKTDGTIAVYANGRLVHRAQVQGPLWNSTRTPLWVLLNKASDGAPLNEILVRMEHTQSAQVAVSSLWLGPVEALEARHRMRQWLQQELPAMLSAAFMAVGVFALFVWFRRSHETGYLLFFNLATTSFLRSLHFYVGVPVANDWFAWLTVNSLFWLVAVVHFALRQLHGRRLKWLTCAVVAWTALTGVLTLPGLAILRNTPQVTPLIYIGAALMGVAVALVGGVSAWRRSGEGRLVAVGIGVCVLLGVSDWLLQNNFVSPEGWYLGAYTNAVTFSVFGVLMYRRYVSAIAEVERVNASLARRLEAREAELELSHRRLREVEKMQTISDERQRLMQDMHDGLGSSLISAIRSVEGGSMSDDKVSQMLKSCLDDLKLTIDSMEPLEDDLLLLLATLRYRLGPRLESSGVALQWEVQELPALDWLDPTSALHILRIVQESIANVLRHTRATGIRVGTERQASGVRVSIEDNGQGFDVEKAMAGAGGRGMQNQQRRAQAIGGAVSWRSGPQGTLFTLWLPLKRGERVA